VQALNRTGRLEIVTVCSRRPGKSAGSSQRVLQEMCEVAVGWKLIPAEE